MNENVELHNLLQTLWKLDKNGWANLTDGTLDNMPTDEQIEVVWQAICEVRKNS